MKQKNQVTIAFSLFFVFMISLSNMEYTAERIRSELTTVTILSVLLFVVLETIFIVKLKGRLGFFANETFWDFLMNNFIITAMSFIIVMSSYSFVFAITRASETLKHIGVILQKGLMFLKEMVDSILVLMNSPSFIVLLTVGTVLIIKYILYIKFVRKKK